MSPSTHDLLRITDVTALVCDEALPEFAQRSLDEAPWVVVCRRPRRGGLLPVGIRGNARHERQLAWLPAEAAAECVTPEMLAGRRGWLDQPRAAEVPALRVLEQIAMVLEGAGLAWGPAGSVAFELATGRPTATSASDLDLVLRPTSPLSRRGAQEILTAWAQLPVRVDALIETDDGAMSLREFVDNSPHVVMRTLHGPFLWRKERIVQSV